jgi:hypothetical protein
MLIYLFVGIIVSGLVWSKYKNNETYKNLDHFKKTLFHGIIIVSWIVFIIQVIEDITTDIKTYFKSKPIVEKC